MKSLRNSVPLRITEVPYIKDKHHRISAEIIKRDSIAHYQIVWPVIEGLKRESTMMITSLFQTDVARYSVFTGKR